MRRALFTGWLLLTSLLGSGASVAGPGQTDTLLLRLQCATADSARQRLLLQLAYELSLSKPGLGQQYARRALAIAATRHDAAGLTRIYLQLGQLANNRNALDSARHWYEKALALARPRHDTVALGLSLANLAAYYSNIGDNRRALSLGFQVTRLPVRPGRERALVLAYNLIGRVHQMNGENRKALGYFQRALQLVPAADAGARESTLFNLGLASLNIDSLAAAQRYFEASARVARAENDLDQLGLVHLAMAEVATARHDAPQTLRYARQGEAVFRQLGDSLNLAQALLAVGQALRDQGQPKAALPLLREAALMAQRSGVVPIQQAAYSEQQATYEVLGDYAAALRTYRLVTRLADSIRNSDNDRHLAQLESQYQFAEKNKKIALLSAEQRVQAKQVAIQRLITYGLLGGLLLVLGLVGLLWQRYRLIKRTNHVIENEKQRSDELLLNILPAETARELKETGHALARHHAQVTVLFADVENFTQLAERLPPELIVSTLDAYFGAFDRITERFGLEKIKTIGDAYMMAGGLGSRETHPAVVVRAAFAMNQAVADLRAQREPRGEPWFVIRMGIHTGPVVAGIVGIKKFAYDIWGDTVNTAARMEQAGEPGRINISEATHEWVEAQFECTPRGRVAAKNKGEVAMYFVDREKPPVPVEE